MTIEERLQLLQMETNAWANGGWPESWDKQKLLNEGKKLNRKSFHLCITCGERLHDYCKYPECQKCRRKYKSSLKTDTP